MTSPLPDKAADTTAEQPWPVRVLSLKIADYVDRMSQLWVEGQVVQFNPRGGTAFLTLRDPDVDMSLSVSVPMNAVNAMPIPLAQGARVVLQAKPTFWTKRGTLQLEARQIRPVGIGDLLARVEILKRTLAAEGVFDAERKRPIPFLPKRVGLVTGRSSAAEKDVVENARRRWPAVRFEIREVAVQGTSAVTEVVEALRELDAHPEVEVIVIARGGGALEELLPFSNEAMVRAVAAARTPVISAIGHDVDQPLLDLVADWRASTPTDAGKKVVPDAQREFAPRRRGPRPPAPGAGASPRDGAVGSAGSRQPPGHGRPGRPRAGAPRGDRRAALRAPRCGSRPGCTARVTRPSTSVARSSRSPRSRPSSGGMPSCSIATAASSWTATTSGVGELLRVRVARGDFGVRPVSDGITAATDDKPEPHARAGGCPSQQSRAAHDQGLPAQDARRSRRRVAAMPDPAASTEPSTRETGAPGGGDVAFPDIAAMRYEDAREELVSIVSRLETGQAPLEDSMQLWRRGEALAAHCSRWLDDAQSEIEQATRPAPSPAALHADDEIFDDES